MEIIKEKFVAEYDFSDYLHNTIDNFKEDKQEFLVSMLWDEERDVKDVTDEEIENYFYNDPFLHDEHWEDFKYMLEEEFEQHIGKEVRVEGTNMGWRNLNGHKEFTINKTIDVFSEIIPNTSELTFRIEGLGNNKYAIRISHHDSPMGEHYELTIKE